MLIMYFYFNKSMSKENKVDEDRRLLSFVTEVVQCVS